MCTEEYSGLLCKGKEKPQSYDKTWRQGRPPHSEAATIKLAAVTTIPGFHQLA
jgi:hypothetical protein